MIEKHCSFLVCFQPVLNRSIQPCQFLVFLKFSWIRKAATIEHKASSMITFITGNSRSSKSKRIKIKEHGPIIYWGGSYIQESCYEHFQYSVRSLGSQTRPSADLLTSSLWSKHPRKLFFSSTVYPISTAFVSSTLSFPWNRGNQSLSTGLLLLHLRWCCYQSVGSLLSWFADLLLEHGGFCTQGPWSAADKWFEIFLHSPTLVATDTRFTAPNDAVFCNLNLHAHSLGECVCTGRLAFLITVVFTHFWLKEPTRPQMGLCGDRLCRGCDLSMAR